MTTGSPLASGAAAPVSGTCCCCCSPATADGVGDSSIMTTAAAAARRGSYAHTVTGSKQCIPPPLGVASSSVGVCRSSQGCRATAEHRRAPSPCESVDTPLYFIYIRIFITGYTFQLHLYFIIDYSKS